MKSYKKELHFNLPTRRGLVNITRDVQQAIDESGVKEGLFERDSSMITMGLKTMPTLILREVSWEGNQWSLSPTADLTSVHGSRFSTMNSMVREIRECSSR